MVSRFVFAWLILIVMDVSYPVGSPPRRHTPLARFLPPLDEGSVVRALEDSGVEGGLILDPFGASPRLPIEAVQSGCPVMVAVNNPVTRFILKHTLDPFSVSELQAALARLASAPKDEGRLEPFLLDLYRTECAKCGAAVIAEFFIWDRELERPTHKVFACERCNYSGESTTSAADLARAERFTHHSLQHALALEQVASAGDPDREHAQAALSVYPGRALYALITLVTKMAQTSWEPRLYEAAQALMLSAFDASNALWGYPEGRSRPRQLSASPRYREINVWYALEQAVEIWAMEDPGIEHVHWTEGPLPDPGVVAVFPGPLRELLSALPEDAVPEVVTVLPRPNQAFWTLCALWAAWLWGRDAAAPIKVALRRRRYDWAWHASALRTVLSKLGARIDEHQALVAFVPEAEPGFTAAALASLDGVGFKLEGCAIRGQEGRAFFTWTKSEVDSTVMSADVQRADMRQAAIDFLMARGEPTPYALLHTAVWCHLAEERQLAHLWQREDGHPLSIIGDLFQSVIADRNTFKHLGRGVEVESGQYWLVESADVATPLSDRVEELVLGIVRSEGGISEFDLDQRVCTMLPGLLTPDQRLVRACLESYAYEDPERRLWYLRPEDQPEAREADCKEMSHLLADLGRRLGFSVQETGTLRWLDERGNTIFEFAIMETAAIGTALQSHSDQLLTFVMPGGRAGLVAEKSRRDPRLRTWLADDTRVIKFRHVRRLAIEATLTRENLRERMGIDPPGHHDPQLPLL